MDKSRLTSCSAPWPEGLIKTQGFNGPKRTVRSTQARTQTSPLVGHTGLALDIMI